MKEMAGYDEMLEAEEIFYLTVFGRKYERRKSLNRTRDTQGEYLLVKQMREVLTISYLFVNTLPDVLEQLAVPLRVLTIKVFSGRIILRQITAVLDIWHHPTVHQRAGVQHLSSPIRMCRLNVKCVYCVFIYVQLCQIMLSD